VKALEYHSVKIDAALIGPERRFPPPWSVEETDACFIVKDHTLRLWNCYEQADVHAKGLFVLFTE